MKIEGIENMHHLDVYTELLRICEKSCTLIEVLYFNALVNDFELKISSAVIDGKISESMAYSYIVEAQQMGMRNYKKIRKEIWN